MKIIVCMKQVPSSNDVHLDPVTNTIIRDGNKSIINPFDSSALEQAVEIKERLGGEVTVLSMGIPDTQRLLRDALSRGCDKAVLLSDSAFAGSDTLATAYTLGLGVKKIGKFDLILCGKMAVDGDTAQIGPELAENLNIPHVTDVDEVIFVNDKEIICSKLIDGGSQILNVPLPALITVVKDIKIPRLPSIKGIRFSQTASLEILTAQDISADITKTGLNGSPTQVVKTFTPVQENTSVEFKGNAKKIAKQIASVLGEVL
ncbi:MAG TPA: electron transfer flavoprotein subunit beta [Lachnospiraceae bacterium]|nr:electron transfer flavoprotein subunit beta [Lachnospiraceae bacterium]